MASDKISSFILGISPQQKLLKVCLERPEAEVASSIDSTAVARRRRPPISISQMSDTFRADRNLSLWKYVNPNATGL